MQNWFRPELKTTICAQQKIAKAHTKKRRRKTTTKIDTFVAHKMYMLYLTACVMEIAIEFKNSEIGE